MTDQPEVSGPTHAINPTKGVPPLLTRRLDPQRDPSRCAWFMNCENPSGQEVSHPTLGFVQICDDHLEWLLE